MRDEELVVLAQECEFLPARDELILRFHNLSNRLICRSASPRGVHAVDVEDAQQDAVFWVVEAIDHYDTRLVGICAGCSFRSFFYRVLTARLNDFFKHLRRVQSRHRPSWQMGLAGCGDGLVDHRAAGDPLSNAAQQESMRRLREALDELDGTTRTLWTMLAFGKRLRVIAAELGLSYDAVKRRRRKLVKSLSVRLGERIRPRSSRVHPA